MLHYHESRLAFVKFHYENFRYNHLATVTNEGQKAKPVMTSK